MSSLDLDATPQPVGEHDHLTTLNGARLAMGDTPVSVRTVLDRWGVDNALYGLCNAAESDLPAQFAFDCALDAARTVAAARPELGDPATLSDRRRMMGRLRPALDRLVSVDGHATNRALASALIWAQEAAADADHACDARQAWRDAKTGRAMSVCHDLIDRARAEILAAQAEGMAYAFFKRPSHVGWSRGETCQISTREAAAWVATERAIGAAKHAAEAAASAAAAGGGDPDAARDDAKTRQAARLRQYLTHGLAATDMPAPKASDVRAA